MVTLLPHDPSARINLALVYVKLGKKVEAVAELQHCLKLDPANQVARSYLNQLQP